MTSNAIHCSSWNGNAVKPTPWPKMKNRFKAKPNVSAARERARAASTTGGTIVGSDASLQFETGAFYGD